MDDPADFSTSAFDDGLELPAPIVSLELISGRLFALLVNGQTVDVTDFAREDQATKH